MASSTKTFEEKIKQWESTRIKGRKSFVIRSWVVPFGIVLPLVMVLCTSAFTIAKGISIKVWSVFLAVFLPIFMVISAFAGFSSWKYHEQRYDRWISEKREGVLNLPGTRKIFLKYRQLMLGIIGIPVFVLNLLFFFLAIFIGSKYEVSGNYIWIIIVTFFTILILSFLPVFNIMVFVKNPICGHGILSNPDHLHRHPDAKGNYWKNAWKIIKGDSFICLDCSDEYIFEKRNGKIEVIKITKENSI